MAKSVYEILLKVSGGQQATREMGDIETHLKKLEEASNRMQLVSGALDGVGRSLSGLGDQLLDVSDKAAVMNASMERGLTNLQNITGASREEIENYNSELEGVLETTGYQIDANDLLISSYDAASAGFTDTADAMAVMSKAAELAIAGNGNLGNATDNMASSQKAVIAGMKSYSGELEKYGDTSAQAAVISEKMYKIIEKGITDISILAPEFAELAPLAKSAGVSLDDLAASFAAITSQGIKTNIATTNMKALFNSIAKGGGTKEAQDMIEKLGLKFNSATLEAEGLTGVLASLKENGIDTLNEFVTLTGNVEAASALAVLSDQAADFNGKLDHMVNGVTDLKEKVDNLSDDPMGRLVAATNKFNRELGLAGENLTPVKGTLMELGAEVLEKFNALPEPLKEAVGSLVVIGGAASKGIGTILQLVSQIATAVLSYKIWQAELAKTIVLQKADAVSKGTQTAATLSLTRAKQGLIVTSGVLNKSVFTLGGGFKVFGASMVTGAAATATMVAGLAALGAAIAAGIIHLRNIKKEAENEELFGKLQETEPIAQGMQKLGEEIKRTGKAIPQKELDKWVNLAREAQGESEVLEGHIRALTNVNNQAKQGTQELTTAQEKQVSSNEGLQDSTEALEKAEEERAKAVEKLRGALEDQLTQVTDKLSVAQDGFKRQMDEGTISIENYYTSMLSSSSMATEGVKAAYDSILSSSKLTAEERKDLERDYTQALRGAEKERLDLIKQAQEDRKKNWDSIWEIRKQELITQYSHEKRSSEELNEALKDLETKRLRERESQITKQLETVTKGSHKERELALELWGIRGQLANQEVQDRDAAEKEKIRLAEETKQEEERLAKEAKETKKREWEEETEYYKTQLSLRLQEAKLVGDQLSLDLEIDSAFNDAGLERVGLYKDAVGAIFQEEEKRAKLTQELNKLQTQETELTKEQLVRIQEIKGELKESQLTQDLLNKEVEYASRLLGQVGITVGNIKNTKDLELQITRVQLELEYRQLENKTQSELIQIRLNQLSQESLILEQQKALLAEGISEKEVNLINQRIQGARDTIALLEKQEELVTKSAQMQADTKDLAAGITLAKQGIDPRGLGGSKLETSLNPQDVKKLEDPLRNLETQGREGTSNLLKGIASSQETSRQGLGEVRGAVDSQLQKLEGLTGVTGQGFGSSIAATQAQTQELRDQLASLEQATRELPGKIAASMPRSQETLR